MDLARILELCPEVEVSEWLPDLEAAGNGADPSPLHDPVPARGPDAVAARPEASQQDIVAPLTTGGETQAKPRRPRKVAQAAPVAGDNGHGEPDLSKKFMFTEEVADLLRVHRGSVLRWVAKRTLPGIEIGNRKLIPTKAVLAFIESRRVQPKAWAMRRQRGKS